MKTKVFLFAAALSLATLSCDKDENVPVDANLAADARISAELDQISDDISLIAENQFDTQNPGGRSTAVASNLPDCAVVTTESTSTTWTRQIDFGDGCEMPNGNILSGIIIISGSVDFDQPMMTITYSFDNFYHNNRLVEGGSTLVRTMQSTAQNAEMHPVVNIAIDFTVTYPNGNVYTRAGNRERELIIGYNTPMWQDNVYLVSGNWATTFPNHSQTATITTPLRVELSCQYIVSGELTIVRNDNTGVLNYGDGQCDNQATLTINGVETPITLGN